jgi:hypothetical protein
MTPRRSLRAVLAAVFGGALLLAAAASSSAAFVQPGQNLGAGTGIVALSADGTAALMI